MKAFNFTLILNAPTLAPEDAHRLYEAGCDDSTVGSRDGVSFLDFTREARSLEEAIRSAVSQVADAQFKVVRVEPDDLVTQSEIAERSNLSRQNIGQLVHGDRGPGGFPRPVARVMSTSPLWRWREVSRWLEKNDKLSKEAVKEAEVFAKMNRELGRAALVR